MGLFRFRQFHLIFVLLIISVALPFQNCARIQFDDVKEVLPDLQSRGEGGRVYDGKLAITNILQDAPVAGYQVFNGLCLDGVGISLTYSAGATGPSAISCVGGIFSFAVSFSGAPGARTVTLAQMNSSSALDTLNFNVTYSLSNLSGGSGFTGSVFVSASDPVTGKIYVGGDFTAYGGTSVGRIARLNPDGTLDSSFNQGSGFNSKVYGLLYDPGTQGVYVTGNFDQYNGTPSVAIARLRQDGSYDSSFNVGTGFNSDAYGMALDPVTQQLYVAGWFTSYRGVAAQRIVRINTNGAIDSTFDTTSGANDGAFSVAVEPSSRKVYVGGVFGTYRGSPNYKLVKLNLDGSPDASFTNGGLNGVGNGGTAIVIDSAERVYIAGVFQYYGSGAAENIVRIRSDGTRDTAFVVGSGFNGAVESLALDRASNQLYVSGQFTTFNGSPANRMTLLRPDGSIEPSFVSGTGFNGSVVAMALSNLGKNLFAFGSFTLYNTTPVSGTVSLSFDGSLSGR